MAREIIETWAGNVRLLSDHPTLTLVARTLAESLKASAIDPDPTDIWIGLHRTRRLSRRPGRRLIVLQTEQILNEAGTQIYGKITKKRLRRMALSADLLVEWNPVNRPFYGILPRLMPKRFLFGPYVFPDSCPQRAQGAGTVFFGALNERRSALLAQYPGTRILPGGLSAAQIDEAIDEAAAILNLHSLPGTYSEVPRVLMALLAGKPMLSEPLAAPFDRGAVLPPGTPLTEESLDQSYSALCAAAQAHPISEMLRQAHRA